jgi:hypothetical protein
MLLTIEKHCDLSLETVCNVPSSHQILSHRIDLIGGWRESRILIIGSRVEVRKNEAESNNIVGELRKFESGKLWIS